MTLLRPRPFPELPTLREAIDRLFDEAIVSPGMWLPFEAVGRPALDAYTTPEAFVVKAELPGFAPDEIHTEVTGDTLTIEAKRGEEQKREERGYVYRERRRGELRRTLTLPPGLKVDEAEATYVDGVLTLTIPKLPEAKPREIKVKAA